MSRSARWLRHPVALAALLFAGFGCGGGDDRPIVPPPPGSISGTVFAAESQYTDSDVNTTVEPGDPPLSPPVSNDQDFAEAQLVPVPAVVGGYVTLPGEGEAGGVSSGDVRDYFLADLKAGHVVTLVIADDPTNVDLDLWIFDEAGTPVANSRGTGSIETWTVVSDGRYVIEVRVFEIDDPDADNASNYTLLLGPTGPPIAAFGALDPESDFVPGQVLVQMRSGGSPGKANVASTSTREGFATSLGMRALAGAPDRPMLFDLGNSGERAVALRTLGVKRSEPAHRVWLAASDEKQARMDTVLAVRALRARSDVLHADLNYIRRPFFEPNDEHYPLQWHYPLINLPLAWDVTAARGAGATVAVIDTGILAHPDLVGQYSGGFDFIRDADSARDGEATVPGEGDIDSDPTDTGDGDPDVGLPHSYHGSHVAGTIAAATDNGVGVAGVAFGAQLLPLRVCGYDGCTGYDIIQAVRYASGLSNDSNVVLAQPVDVINLSLGGLGGSASEQAAYIAARAQGVIVVAAAGNSANGVPMFPASFNGVISVSAVDLTRSLAPYSSFGANVDVAAPGGDTSSNLNSDPYVDGVLSTLRDSQDRYNYVFYQGTSMAAPHMSGVAALMRAEAPSMTPSQLDDLIDGSSPLSPITEDLGAAGRDDEYGHGLIDARLAVQAAIEIAGGGGGLDDAQLVVSPASLSFPARTTSRVISVSQGGQGALSLQSPIVSSETWLEVTEQSVDANGLGSYLVSLVAVEFAMLPDGIHAATLTLLSTKNTVVVDILAQKGGEQYPNTGYQFLLLLEADAPEAEVIVAIPIDSGEYAYRVEDVPRGEYFIIIGTDLDNDGFICDEGEACGAYPQLDAAELVQIDGDLSGFDFTTGYAADLQTVTSNRPALGRSEGFRIEPASREAEPGLAR